MGILLIKPTKLTPIQLDSVILQNDYDQEVTLHFNDQINLFINGQMKTGQITWASGTSIWLDDIRYSINFIDVILENLPHISQVLVGTNFFSEIRKDKIIITNEKKEKIILNDLDTFLYKIGDSKLNSEEISLNGQNQGIVDFIPLYDMHSHYFEKDKLAIYMN